MHAHMLLQSNYHIHSRISSTYMNIFNHIGYFTRDDRTDLMLLNPCVGNKDDTDASYGCSLEESSALMTAALIFARILIN
jgi:hypothetical protein